MVVVPTKGIPEGFAALMAYDPDAEIDQNAGDMATAAANVVAGEVTRAVRDSTCDVGPIAEGDFLGIARDGIRAVAPGVADATIDLLSHLLTDDHEIVTLIEGEGSTAAETRRILHWLEEHPIRTSRPRRTTAASRCTRTSSASNSAVRRVPSAPMSSGPITYAELASFPLTAIRALFEAPKKVAALEKVGVHDVLDLLTYYPRRHVDRSRQVDIRNLRPGEEAMVVGRVERHTAHRPPRKGRGRPLNRDEFEVSDGTGGRLRVTFFNQVGHRRQLPVGTEACSSGRSTRSTGASR